MDKLLKQKIDKSEYVSFDIFDTLILRKVIHPHDIFEIVEHKYKKQLGDTFFGLYKQLRFQAENQARELNYKRSLEEPDFDEIFECLKERCNLNEEQIKYLKDTELKTEEEFCVRNNYMFKAYEYCIKNNKKIILNSDMYLSYDIILKILENNGYKEFKKLYLSSQTGCSKSSGKAYLNILKELKASPEEILHIGDNKFSDIEQAEKHGINTFYYQKPVDRASDCKHFMHAIDKPLKTVKDRLIRSIYKAIVINNFYSPIKKTKTNFWYEIGFKKGGLLLSNYLFWILKQAEEHNIDYLALFSRDGYVLEKMINVYKQYNCDIPKYNYTLSSRWAFLISSLKEEFNEVDAENILFNLSLNIDNLSERIEFLGLNPQDYKDYFKEFIDISKNLELFRKDQKEQLLSTPLIKNILEDIKKASLVEKENFEKYFNQKGMLDSKNLGVIDAFGHGTCQYYLEKCLSKMETKIENINGYYLGIYSPDGINKKYPNINQKGFLFDGASYDHHLMPIKDIYFYELLATAPHGSFVRFNNNLEPIFDNDDLNSKNIIIKDIHQGIIDFFKEYIHVYEYLGKPEVAADTILKLTSRLMRKPTIKESINLGNTPIIDSGSKKIKYFAKPSIRDFIEPIINKNYDCPIWTEGYYKRLLMGLNLPNKKELTTHKVLNSKKLSKNIINMKKKYKDKEICLYGAGALAKSILEKYDFSILNIKGVIDSDISKKGKLLLDYEILHTTDLKEINPDIIIITVLRGEKLKPCLAKLKKEEQLKYKVIELF